MVFNQHTSARLSLTALLVQLLALWHRDVAVLTVFFSCCLMISIRCYCLIALCSWLHLDDSSLSDGLVDCLDPDCCLQSTCQNSLLCRGSRDPLDIIQQSHSGSPAVKSFYDRIKLLVGKDSTHIIPGENPFNSR